MHLYEHRLIALKQCSGWFEPVSELQRWWRYFVAFYVDGEISSASRYHFNSSKDGSENDNSRVQDVEIKLRSVNMSTYGSGFANDFKLKLKSAIMKF